MSRYLTYHVKSDFDGKTVQHVAHNIFDISASLLKSMKRTDGIRCNGKHCRTVDIIHIGDVLQFAITDTEESDIRPNDIPLAIVYEDDDILILDKQGGISMHPSITEQHGTIANAVIYHFAAQNHPRVFHAVNRLDKETSGLCLIAKNRYSHAILSKQIQNQMLRRRYYAVIHGHIFPEQGKIDKPIQREEGSILRRVVSATGKAAVTNYRTVSKSHNYSLLDIALETGRTHQIRVHLADTQHPLVGDWLYGNGDKEKMLISRQALHSYFIIFQHPIKRHWMSFYAPLPDDMSSLL